MTKVPAGEKLEWRQAAEIPSQTYQCPYCGNALASNRGWTGWNPYDGKASAFVCICHYCANATFIDDRRRQHPGVLAGNPVKDIPDPAVQAIYDEARVALGAGAFTASVLTCRKLLMHIAVSKGAAAGGSFAGYVKYLNDNHYVPAGSEDWVDHIRKKSNEANHEITLMSRDDAEELLSFSEMLLKVMFEFPAAVRKKVLSASATTMP